MKCPKCGYLGFETTDRCRNCQYDFSLAPFSSESELSLQSTDAGRGSDADFELPPIQRQTDNLAPLDLDRMFGEEQAGAPADEQEPRAIEIDPDRSPRARPFATTLATAEAPEAPTPPEAPEAPKAPEAPAVPRGPAADLPFDDGPIVPPPAARPPLAVRRATPEVPRNRPRTTRPVKVDPALALEPEKPPVDLDVGTTAGETMASLAETPALGARVAAGLVDLLLLAAIDLAVLVLTLRVTGLQNTYADLRVLPPVPFVSFLALIGFGYVAAFTVAGGQTIGKMILRLRVIGDDGRPVDPAGGMLRALGCMLVPVTLGLSYVPALVTSDHRALHDRLAGTRVVRE